MRGSLPWNVGRRGGKTTSVALGTHGVVRPGARCIDHADAVAVPRRRYIDVVALSPRVGALASLAVCSGRT